MVNPPNRSKQQQPTHTPGAFPELTRHQLEELCLRQNQCVAELLAALKLVRDEYCEGGMLDGTPADEPEIGEDGE